MKRTLFFIALAIVTLTAITSCKIETTKDYVKQQTKIVNVQPFNAIVNNTYADVHFTPSDKYEVKITGSEKLVKRISVKVSNGNLIISGKGEDEVNYIYSGKHAGIAEVWVKAPTLNAISETGSGDIYIEGTITTSKLSVTAAGSGDITTGGINCSDSLQITTLGAGDISLNKPVKAKATGIYASGAGDFSIGNLTSQKVEIQSLGSGDVSARISQAAEITVNNSGSGDIDLDVDKCGIISGGIIGSGDVSVRGTAKSCDISSSGSGDVIQEINKQ